MNKQLRPYVFSALSGALLCSTALADKPAKTGKPENPGNSANQSSYQYVEDEIKQAQENLNAEAAKEKANLQEKLVKEMQKKDGFDAQSREVLGKYVSENKGSWKNHSSLPPGLQKKVARGGDLPPGWQKKLQLGQPIPKDIWEYSQPLPEDIAKKIPHPEGTEDVMIEDEIYRVTKKTRQIIDILSSPTSGN